jgi:hypothetical protein
MNKYRHKFVCHCPNNARSIVYELEISTPSMIHVERIVETCKAIKSAFHEALADDLYVQFGGVQLLRAHHHGVDIETVRP